eukprot:COSAG01_NODE_2584_length_7418_cov_4.468643_1_plen_326_part_00
MILLLALVPAGGGVRAEGDRVTSLPGVDHMPPWAMYSGYVPVGGGRQLFYWLFESQRNASSDPLVLWMNGGPGCSSLLGALTEHGPLLVAAGVVLQPNEWSWNRQASVLYLEQPAGVGYSFGGSGASGDGVASKDNLMFLRGFFLRHPALRSRPFFISGESHAGLFVPMLAQQVQLANGQAPAEERIALRGILVGNPSGLESAEWSVGVVSYAHHHGLLSDEQTAAVAAACNASRLAGTILAEFEEENCTQAMAQLYGPGSNLGRIDPYNVLMPCEGKGPQVDNRCATARAVAVAALPPSATAAAMAASNNDADAWRAAQALAAA